MRRLLVLVTLTAAASGCATSGALEARSVPAYVPLGTTGVEVGQIRIEAATRWSMLERTPLERVVVAGEGEVLLVVQFDVRDARTHRPADRRSFESFTLETDTGEEHQSPLRQTNIRNIPFVVPAGTTPKVLRIDQDGIDVLAAAISVPAGRFVRLGPRLRRDDRIQVTTSTGALTGHVLALTDDELHVRHRGRTLRFACTEVQRVEVVADTVASGATIGASIGGGLGGLLFGPAGLFQGLLVYGGIGVLFDLADSKPTALVYVAGPKACAAAQAR